MEERLVKARLVFLGNDQETVHALVELVGDVGAGEAVHLELVQRFAVHFFCAAERDNSLEW